MNDYLSFFYNYRVISFYLLILLLLFLNRNKFEVQEKIIFLYKTKFGLKLMDKIASKYNKLVKSLATVGIWVGYLGFIVITFSLIKILFSLLQKPDLVAISPVLPGVPIAGTSMVFPLVIGWIALFIIIIVHEFSHGVVARAYNLKVLSSGIAFFGPLMGAFVEPDEKQISKQSEKVQNSIYAAGPFSNILLTIVAVGLIFLIPFAINPISSIDGLVIKPISNFSANNAGMINEQTLLKINGVNIVNDYESFSKIASKLKPGDKVTLKTKEDTFIFNAGTNPNNEELGYMGIYIKGYKRIGNTPFYNIIYKILLWFNELLFWIAFISINIGLINLYPIFITDGSRMIKIILESRMKDKKKAANYWLKINKLSVLLLVSIILIQIFNWVSNSFLA